MFLQRMHKNVATLCCILFFAVSGSIDISGKDDHKRLTLVVIYGQYRTFDLTCSSIFEHVVRPNLPAHVVIRSFVWSYDIILKQSINSTHYLSLDDPIPLHNMPTETHLQLSTRASRCFRSLLNSNEFGGSTGYCNYCQLIFGVDKPTCTLIRSSNFTYSIECYCNACGYSASSLEGSSTFSPRVLPYGNR